MKQPSETEIMNAIDYALRREAIEEVLYGEEGEWTVEINDPNVLKPFVMCLLRELQVIP